MKRTLVLITLVTIAATALWSCRVQEGEDENGKAFTDAFNACREGYFGECEISACTSDTLVLENTALSSVQTFTNYQDQWGQSFTVSETIELKKMEIRFRGNSANPASEAYLNLYRVEGSATSGGLIATSATSTSITTSYSYVSFTFDDPPELEANQEYVVFVVNDGRVDMEVDSQQPSFRRRTLDLSRRLQSRQQRYSLQNQ